MTPTSDASRKAAPAFLALAAVGFIATASDAHAADPVKPVDPAMQDRDRLIVTGQELKSEQESPKSTRPVRDTPQTVTIITNKTIEEQNLLTLRDVLSTVPGITFGAGEGGGGYGDSIVLRGFSANTDITQDGVRDSAQYSRTDSFNLEQLEVVNGANSVYGGSGSVGGSVNIVTKRPQAQDATTVTGGVGTDRYYRGTLDTNHRVSDLIAVRLNAMVHRNDVPGRDWEKYERWGVAPSVKIGADGPTSLTLTYLHQEDMNLPSYGVPYYIGGGNAGPIAGVDRSSYFGFRNIDRQDINVDQATAIFDHAFSDRLSVRNLTRWQDVRQLSIVNPPQGTFCLTGGVTANGVACAPAGFYQPSGPRGTLRDTRNQLMYNQTDFRAVADTGGIEHTIVLGISASWEKYFLDSGNVQRNPDGSATTYPLINIANPDAVVTGPAGFAYGSNVYTGPVNYIPNRRDHGELENYAIYLFDTVAFGDHFELNGGVRYERNKGWYRRDAIASSGANIGELTTGTRFDNADNLFSYRVGLVYKPVEAVSIYAAYSNARTPSKTSVNGSCDAATCNVAPESAKLYEIGIKAETMGGRLLLSASAFRNERDQYKVDSGDPLIPAEQLDGKARVDGIALSAIGQITRNWSITANYTYLDSEVLRSIARNSPPGTIDPQAGNPLTNTPEHSGSLFTTYQLPFGVTLGYGMTYQGSFFLNTSVATMYQVPDYMIHNAFVSWQATPKLSLQLNVKNVADAEYYTRIRNNASTSVGWATPGDGRAAVLSASYRF